jgi:hypothetical protein
MSKGLTRAEQSDLLKVIREVADLRRARLLPTTLASMDTGFDLPASPRLVAHPSM